MRRFQRTAFAVGAVVTAMVLMADLLTGFRWLEDWTVDLRLMHARTVEEPPGDQVRLVAIDDASLDTIGRWPWPRERIAMALDETARAGARVAVFDVLFLEPEEGTRGDEQLAAAMRKIKTVVAVSVRGDKMLDAAWDSPAGKRSLKRFADAVRKGVDRDARVLVEEAALQEPFRSRVLERPAAFKSLAAWMVLDELSHAGTLPKDLPAFVAVMLGGSADAERVGAFGERPLLERAWRRGESWRSIQKSLKADTASRGSPQDLPPIPEIAAAGAMFGVVNADPDRFDGRLRRLTPLFATDFGQAPQLGLAAALAYQGGSAESLSVQDDVLRMRDRTAVLQKGKLTIDWPTRLLGGYGDAQGDDAVVSIGRLVEQAQNRQRMATQRARMDALGRDIATGLLGKDAAWFEAARSDGRLQREVDDIWENDYAAAADDPSLTPEQKVSVASLREWRLLHGAVREGEAKLAESDARLRTLLGDKLVFFGFTATGTMADMVSTIFDPRTPGVFGHIAAADMMLNGRTLRFAPAWTSPLAVVLLGLTAALVAARFGAGAGFVALLMLLACYAGLLGVVGFDRFDIVYPMAAPVLAGLNSWVTATAAVAVINQREKLRIQKQFRARVSPQLVDLLAENPKALSMGGVERETTILFGDLAGFTTISEQLGGPDVVKTLNLYMGAMTRELTAQNAYVNKFLGDGLLAFWSAFVPEPRQCELAIASAIACQRLVKEIGERPDRAGLPPITLRLGIATGKVVIGDCGAPPDLNDYTVIGDSVNLAARLESANKQFGTSILIDGTTAVAARSSGLPLCSLGRVVVVGQSVPIDLHEVCIDADPMERIRMTEQAVQAFAGGDFTAAREAFGALEGRFGKSKAAIAFREAMDDPNDRRDGVLRLRAK